MWALGAHKDSVGMDLNNSVHFNICIGSNDSVEGRCEVFKLLTKTYICIRILTIQKKGGCNGEEKTIR